MNGNSSAPGLGSGISLSYLAACGETAAGWLATLEDGPAAGLSQRIYRSLVLFRNHDAAQACALLDSVARDLGSAPLDPASINQLVLRRWHAATAYRRYLDGDLDGARASLDEAEAALGAAASAHAFLLPLMVQTIDFHIQRARIARRENRWSEVGHRLDLIREIHQGRHPFGSTAAGPVYLGDLRRFYHSLPLPPESPLLADAAYVLDERWPHLEHIDRLEELVFALPDFVIFA
jgi:hypothetical protein